MATLKGIMGSKPVVALVRAGATLFLAITLVAAGFVACLLPQTTAILADRTVNTELSSFDHDELVKGALATRDYSFFAHDKHALLATIYEMNQGLLASGFTYPSYLKHPKIDTTANAQSMTTEQLQNALYSSNEVYSLDDEAISHLDDVYNVAHIAFIVLGVIVILAIAATAHVVFYRRWRGAWSIFAFAGGGLLVLFIALGIAAAVDFTSFFATFHSFFFTEGSWVFSIDSLLICMLPQGFWIGMGGVWLAVTVLLSALSLFLGVMLRKRGRR